MTYEWSKLSGVKWMDAWEDRFHGNPNFVMEILKGGKSARIRVFCGSKKEAEAIVEQFGGSVRPLPNGAWVNPSQTVQPLLKIRDVFGVTQEADPAKLAKLRALHPQREILSIPAEMAFGTGDHATTSTCLRLLVDIGRSRAPGWSIADLGTGTGLLVIAAKKVGAGEAYACDFDAFSVKATAENLVRNGVTDVVLEEKDVLKWKPRKKYDVVVANLFSTILIQAFPVMAKLLKPGGEIVISGILASQAWEVFTAAAEHGFGFPTVIRKGKWVTARGGWMNDLVEQENV
ncbi:MAG: methyltransferase domain-containing protein [Verrucomicrobia bacterium]|nr:MAG: methyltransferase domain-containing protein [Verrucomicrobiota bacterium]